MSLLFNTLSMFVIAFLPRSKRLLISWLRLPSAVILKPQKIKSLTVSIFSPSVYHEVMGPDAMTLVFWMLSSKPAFWRFSVTLIKRLLGLAWWLRGKESACSAGNLGLIPGPGISPGGGHANPLQYSRLENPKDRRAWQATVHSIEKTQTWLQTKQQ